MLEILTLLISELAVIWPSGAGMNGIIAGNRTSHTVQMNDKTHTYRCYIGAILKMCWALSWIGSEIAQFKAAFRPINKMTELNRPISQFVLLCKQTSLGEGVLLSLALAAAV